jgi:polyisoprenoid-binding protein YceI
MPTRYCFDASQSQFRVRAFAAGMLSFLGHSPTFAVRDFGGRLTVENGMALELLVKADSLALTDPVGDADRREIEGTLRRDVLEVPRYPQILYEAAKVAAEPVAAGRYHLRIGGRPALHGVTRTQPVDADLLAFDDGVRMQGETALRLSDYRIRPVTTLGGTIRLRDEVKLLFDIAGIPEGT